MKGFLINVSSGTDGRLNEWTTVRTASVKWVQDALTLCASEASCTQPMQTPRYLLNNSKSVLALCVKNDYREDWLGAFSELLQVSYQHEIMGIDFIAGILDELEVEVAMFNESRSREEVAHSTKVKNTMRDSEVIESLLSFFCSGIDYLLAAEQLRCWEITAKCLHCVAELVGWVDINLVINFAFPTIGKVMTLYPELKRWCTDGWYFISSLSSMPVCV